MSSLLRAFSAAGALVLVSLSYVAASSAESRPVVAFVDATDTAGIDFVGHVGPTFPAVTETTQRLMQRNMGSGAAVGDYDGDGDLDVYLLDYLGYANRLFRNNLDRGSKTFTDVTADKLGDLGLSRVAHFADLNNDGWLDLLLINDDDGNPQGWPSKVFRNNGDGSFSDVTGGSSFRPVGYIRAGAALADYDRDGLVDIYVTNWGYDLGKGLSGFPGSNQLYRNRGDFVFEEVTTSVGLGGLSRDSFTAIFTDFDGDFYPDLYVAVDHQSDEFYWNNGGVFENATPAVGTTHIGNDMGVACADFDNDGDPDMYVTNITDPTQRTGTTQFNVFYVNQQDRRGATYFLDQAESRGVANTLWGWGVEFVDVENDADLDIVAVTGFDEWVDLSRGGELSPLFRTPSFLFINDGTGHFNQLTGAGLEDRNDSRGLVAFDYDRDGDQDLLITNVNQPVRLLENVSSEKGHWLHVVLEPGKGTIGATVFVKIGDVTRRRDVIAGHSYLVGAPSEVHFGLGAATRVDELIVQWAIGPVEAYRDVPADQVLRFRAPP